MSDADAGTGNANNPGTGDGGQGNQPGGQSDFDAAIEKRLGRQKRQFEKELQAAVQRTREDLLDELDVGDDIEAFKEKLAKAQDGESEQRKTARALAKATKRAEDAEKKLAEKLLAERKVTIRDAIRKAAGADAHTDTVVALVEYSGGVDIGEDGKVTVRGEEIDKAVKKLLTENPHLVKPTAQGGGSGSGPGATTPPAEGEPDLLTREGRLKKLQESGVIDRIMGTQR